MGTEGTYTTHSGTKDSTHSLCPSWIYLLSYSPTSFPLLKSCPQSTSWCPCAFIICPKSSSLNSFHIALRRRWCSPALLLRHPDMAFPMCITSTEQVVGSWIPADCEIFASTVILSLLTQCSTNVHGIN